MKFNTKNIIIPALMTAVGIGLVGSISGTVAWYQYSTRATTSIRGASVKCTEGLQVKVGSLAWGNEFVTSQILGQAHAGANGSQFQPVTSDFMQETAVKSTSDGVLGNFYRHPKYQGFSYGVWGSAIANSYLQYDLWFRVLDVKDYQAGDPQEWLAKKIYFEDFTIVAKDADDNDLDELKAAMRFHFANVTAGETPEYTLLSESAETTYLGSKLDLNNDGAFDKEMKYEWETPAATEKVYGDLSHYNVSAAYSDFVAPAGADGFIDATGKKELGTTVGGTHTAGAEVTDGNELHFVVTIWLEGWHGNSADTGFVDGQQADSIWDAADYLGSVNIGMRFGITEYGQE